MTSRHGSASADGRSKSAKSKAKDDDALMDFAPGKVLGVEELSSVKGSVTAKLSELMGESCDEVFPEYITVMVSNGKTIRHDKELIAPVSLPSSREISTQLEDLLTAGTATVFSKWLGNHLRGLGDKGPAPVSTASSGPAASEPLSSSSKSKAKATLKGRDSGHVGRGANGVSSRGGGGGASAPDDAGVTGRVGGTGGKSKTSGSKVSNTASGGARDAGSREWSKSRSKDRDSWGSSQDRSRDSSRDRSRDAPRNRSRRSRDSPRDWSRDRPRGRGRERPKERSRDRSGDRSRERSKDRSKGTVRDGRNRPRAKSGDSRERDRSRDYGSFATSKDRSRDTNVAPRDRHRNGASAGGGGVGSGGRVNDTRDRTKDHARDNYSRGEERGDGRREGRHGGAANAPAPALRPRGDHDNNGRRTKERSVERSAERLAEQPARPRGGQRDDGAEEEGKRESTNATKRSAGERLRHRREQGERRRDAEAKEGKGGKVRSKKTSTAGEKEDGRDGLSRGGREERAADANSTVVGTPPAKIEEPMVVSVLGSVAVIGDSVRKEELEAANERAKLPDLRTVIERSRRRPNPARNEDVEKEHGDYEKEHGNGEKEHGDGEMEFEDGGKEHEDNRKGLKGEERPVVARGRMAGARGGMRGFSPEAPSNGQEAGVKREFSEKTPPHQLRQRAFVASGGGRLLSTAVKQSVQSAKAPGPDASGGYSGEKRRKSGGSDGRSDGDSNRYVRTSGNGVGDDAVEFDEVPEEAAQAPLEEAKDVITTLRAPGKLRVSAREFQPTSDGVSRAVPPVSPSALVSGPSALSSYEQGGPDTFDSTWQHTRTGEGEDEMYDQDFAAAGYEGSAVRGGHSSNVWSRLGPRANVNGSGSGAGNYNARTTTSAASLSFPADARDFLDAQRLAGGSRGTQTWAEWAQSIGSVPGSPSDAAAKWAAALRVAAGAATAAAASSNNSANVNASIAGGGMGMPLARGGSEDLAYMASYSAAAQAEEGLPFGVAGMGWEESVGGSSGGRGGGRGSRGGPGGRFGRGRAGGRNFTWVREGLRGRGRGRGVPGGRGFRGAGTWRGRGVAPKSLGKGGGWHSTGSAGGRGAGTATAAMAEPGSGVGGRGPAVGQRETWHKVWVRKDLQGEAEGSAGVGAAQQHGEDNS